MGIVDVDGAYGLVLGSRLVEGMPLSATSGVWPRTRRFRPRASDLDDRVLARRGAPEESD